MPAALTVANSGAGSGPAEEKKGEAEASATTAQRSSNNSGGFSPLQDIEAAVALHTPFAHVSVGEEAKSSNQAPAASLASCLRFSQNLLSDHVVITDNGKCASSSHCRTDKFYLRTGVQVVESLLDPTRVFCSLQSNRAQIKLVNNNSTGRQFSIDRFNLDTICLHYSLRPKTRQFNSRV